MLYIHFLNQLTTKSADLESVYLVREIKQKTGYPLSEEKVKEHFLPLFISETEIKIIEEALGSLEQATEKTKEIMLRKEELHESANFQRTLQILKEMPLPLAKNLEFVKEISGWQSSFINEITPLLSKLPKLKKPEEKNSCNQQLNKIFKTVLRNEKFSFNHQDIINEAHLNHINGLDESLEKGFLFKVSLEDEIKKQDFRELKKNLPQEKLEEAEEIKFKVEQIKKAIERSYDVNMRMVNWAVILYAYVKWLLSLFP